MNRSSGFKLFFMIAAALALSTAWAAQSAHKTGPKYDTANEVKIKGVVQEIREVPGDFEGTHLVVKTDTATFVVHVAPSDFLKEMDTTFKEGDVVEVTGAKAPDAPETEILAREIIDGQNTATLRDDKGIPIWAGWKPAKTAGK